MMNNCIDATDAVRLKYIKDKDSLFPYEHRHFRSHSASQSRKASRLSQLLETLLVDPLYAASAHLQIAWSYDNEGKEKSAIPHYKSALLGKLADQERF